MQTPLRCQTNASGEEHWTEIPVEAVVRAGTPKKTNSTVFTLSRGGFAALLAAVDTVQSMMLRARLARAAQAKPILTSALLEREYQNGLTGSDTRWLTVAARGASLIDLTLRTQQIKGGISELEEAGILRPAQRGSVFTETGEQMSADLSGLSRTVGVTLGKAVGLTLFSCASTTWMAWWQDRVYLSQATPEDIEKAIQTLHLGNHSEPPSEALFCPGCGKRTIPGAKFCTACGTNLT